MVWPGRRRSRQGSRSRPFFGVNWTPSLFRMRSLLFVLSADKTDAGQSVRLRLDARLTCRDGKQASPPLLLWPRQCAHFFLQTKERWRRVGLAASRMARRFSFLVNLDRKKGW